MKIIYNPKDGAPVRGFVYKGIEIDPHYPDGYHYQDNSVANGLMQYEDEIAESLLETFEFLQVISQEEAQKILERPKNPEIKCDEPGCDFTTMHKVALAGHKKKHDSEKAVIQGVPVVDPKLIPVAGGKKIQSLAEKKKMMDNRVGTDIPNGTDKDGVDWYGEGLEVDNRSQDFSAVRQSGKGHFIG